MVILFTTIRDPRFPYSGLVVSLVPGNLTIYPKGASV